MEPGIRILVVDDEETLCEVLRFNLEEAGYAVDVACSAEEALALDLRAYSLILLDIMMGEISGIQMARIVRNNKATASVPIIFCTARDGEEEMVGGLDLGADDYIAKPYSIRNLLARVRSVLRRAGRPQAPSGANGAATLVCGGLAVDLHSKQCRLDGQEIRMPRKEFEILALLFGIPRGEGARPRSGREHHAPARQTRRIRKTHRDPHGLRLWLHGVNRPTTAGCFCG